MPVVRRVLLIPKTLTRPSATSPRLSSTARLLLLDGLRKSTAGPEFPRRLARSTSCAADQDVVYWDMHCGLH
jgi:hypothetical protein